MMKLHNTYKYGWGAAVLLATASAYAQEEATTGGEQTMSWLQKPMGMTVLIVGALIVVVLLAIYLINSRQGGRQGPLENYFPESETESSKFEQLLAEIQGLSLRVQGGENKGYYRKIETLGRVFMERVGQPGARQMAAEEIQEILGGGKFPPKQATTLSTFFERCHKGAEHENEKMDFTAAELLKDLRALINQAEEAPPPTIS